jgi:hypothetical protein
MPTFSSPLKKRITDAISERNAATRKSTRALDLAPARSEGSAFLGRGLCSAGFSFMP